MKMARTAQPLAELLALPMNGEQAASLARSANEPLLRWYRRNARDLPWRQNPTPYRVWISEVMLQQTRVEAVKPYYQRFLAALPDLPSLAAAGEETLLKLWEGLGYYSRARNLQKAARQAMERHQGALPPSYEQLLDLSGFGEYTAGAVASIAFGIRVPAVDGNVLRVFSRLLAAEADAANPAVRRAFRELLLESMPPSSPGDFNQAVMELGATLCAPNGPPRCEACPISALCRAFQGGTPAAYPVKAPKKSRRVEERTVFVIVSPEGVLLHKRPPGLLGGLWEFPSADGALSPEEQAAWLCRRGISPEKTVSLRPAKHIFSHVEWHMAGCLAQCAALSPGPDESAARWDELETQYPLPSAFAAFRRALLEYRKGWYHG